jgi:hypothetical protein
MRPDPDRARQGFPELANPRTRSDAVPELPPLVVQIIKTLRQTYDHGGPSAFDDDATRLFHAIGWMIARVCGRERVIEAMKKLEGALNMEGMGEPTDAGVRSIH